METHQSFSAVRLEKVVGFPDPTNSLGATTGPFRSSKEYMLHVDQSRVAPYRTKVGKLERRVPHIHALHAAVTSRETVFRTSVVLYGLLALPDMTVGHALILGAVSLPPLRSTVPCPAGAVGGAAFCRRLLVRVAASSFRSGRLERQAKIRPIGRATIFVERKRKTHSLIAFIYLFSTSRWCSR